MHDFIREIAKPEKNPWRILEAKYAVDGIHFSVAFLIKAEYDVWACHPEMINYLKQNYPELHPRKITWQTFDVAEYGMESPDGIYER